MMSGHYNSNDMMLDQHRRRERDNAAARRMMRSRGHEATSPGNNKNLFDPRQQYGHSTNSRRIAVVTSSMQLAAQQQQQQQDDDDDVSTASRRRRTIQSFTKYRDQDALSVDQRRNRREHSRQLTRQLQQEVPNNNSSLSFADFDAAFGRSSDEDLFAGLSSKSQESEGQARHPGPVAQQRQQQPQRQQQQQRQQQPQRQQHQQPMTRSAAPPPAKDFSFEVNWGDVDPPLSNKKSMSTFPANSSMQSSFPVVGATNAVAAAAWNESRSGGGSVCTASTHDSSMSSPSGGAAARRRRRRSSLRQGVVTTPPHSPSVAASSTTTLFNDTGGFTFDAFGLDASQVDREFNAAIQDIASAHPDLSFFATSSPARSSTAASSSTARLPAAPDDAWEVASAATSRASSPVTDHDGFVQGFRVTTSSSPPHKPAATASTSPTVSTEKSSDYSSAAPVNVFKQQAGFHSTTKPRKVVRPAPTEKSRPDGKNRITEMVPRRSLSPVKRVEQRKVAQWQQQQEEEPVDFVSEDSDDEKVVRSDVGAPSDVGVASDVGSSSNGHYPVPLEIKGRKKGVDEDDADEKKDDDAPASANVEHLLSKWEKQAATPTPVPAKAAARPLPRAHIESLQSQLGDELLSPEKVQFLARAAATTTAAPIDPPMAAAVRAKLRPVPRQDNVRALTPPRLQQESEAAAPPPRESPRLTYRERRELELQAESQGAPEAPSSTTSPRDIAAQIKRRIAANRKAAEEQAQQHSPTRSQQHSPTRPSATTTLSPTRIRPADARSLSQPLSPRQEALWNPSLSPTRAVDSPRTPTRAVTGESTTDTSTSSPLRPLVDESAVPSAVSRVMLLEHLQRKNAPLSPGRSNRFEATSDTSGREDIAHKSSTPKATMMMLNAFLAGRESLSAHEKTDDPSQQSTHDAAPDCQSDHDGPPALKNDPTYERYFTMLKIGMPMEVVKHAMIRDGLDPSVMDGDHNKPVSLSGGIPLKDGKSVREKARHVLLFLFSFFPWQTPCLQSILPCSTMVSRWTPSSILWSEMGWILR
jgi:hypothetical protein